MIPVSGVYLIIYFKSRKKLILQGKKNIDSAQAILKISLKNLSKLMDIKKSINLPNNLSLDVIKLRINSCLEVV